MKKILSLLLLVMMVTQVMADEPFRKHRYDSWKVMSLPENAIVFAGNSITDMHNWTEAFGNNPCIVNRGNSGGYSFEVLDNVESWVRFKPAKVFIKIGTNDLGTDYNEFSIQKNIQKTVNIIRRESPSTEIYLQSILPAYDQKYKTLATIQATNVLIKQIADNTDNTTYIDLYSKMSGILSGSPYSLDNLHLMAYGYKIWTEAIKDYVGITPIYPDNTQTIQSAAGLTGSNGMRATYFSVQPVKSTDILFFGDEMVKNGEWNELLHNQNIKNRGTGWGYGGDIATVSKLIDAAFANAANGVTRQAPAKILLYTGTGDINGIGSDGKTLATAETAYTALIAKLKEKAPSTPILLVSLMPTQNANSNITAFNTWLRGQADADAQLTFVDIYTDLAQASGAAKTEYFDGNYIYGMGYIRVARKLATFIDGCTVLSDSDAQQLKAMTDARITLSKAICTVEDISVGNGVGQYTTTAVASINSLAEQAKTLLAGNASLSDLQSKATAINTALTTLKQSINLPTAENTADRQFALSTPNRLGLYAYTDGQTLNGTNSNPGYAKYRWTIEKRSDGKFNIKNTANNTYINPAAGHNSAIQMSATVPSAGWDFAYSDAIGLYIITSGTNCELNSTDKTGNPIYNWYGTFPNRTDTGCQWLIEDVTTDEVVDEPEPLVKDGKTYTIQGYVKQAGTKRYLTYNGTARSLETAATNDDTQLWTAHQSGQKFYFESVAVPGKYFNFAAHNVNGGVATDATSANVLFNVATGIEEGAVSLQGTPNGMNALRYLASSSDGTKLGDYYASTQTQTGNNGGILWSTDFILTEKDVLPFSVSASVEEAKWNNMTLVNTAKTGEVFDLYSDGSKLKETKNASAEQKAADAYKWAFIPSGNGYIIYSKRGHYLKAATAGDQEVTFTTNASQAAVFTLKTKTVDGSERYVLATTFNGSTETYLAHYSASTLTVHYYNGGAGFNYAANVATFERIATELPNEVTYTINSSTFTNYRDGVTASTGTTFCRLTKSNQSPTLTFGTTANNLQWEAAGEGKNLVIYPGGSSCTYTLQAPTGYVIESYSLTAANASGNTADMTLTIGDKVYPTKTAQQISCTICNETSITIVEKGENKGVVLSNFVVNIKKDVPQMPKFSTNAEQHWYYITSAATNDNATYAKGKVMYYSPSDDRIKFEDKEYDPRHIWSFWKDANNKIAIKNYAGEYFGTPANGTGGGTAFGKAANDQPNYAYTITDAHGYFTITAGTGAPLHAQQSGSLIVRWQAEAGNASLWRFNEVDCSDPAVKVSSTIVQQGRVTTGIGNKNLPILRSTLNVSGLTGTTTVQGVSGTITGTGAASVEKVKVYFATNARELVVSEDATTWRDANAELFGEATINGTSFTCTSATGKALEPGSHYMWIAFDIAQNAKEGTTVDATITGYTVDGTAVAEKNGNPNHAATIFLSEGTVLMPKDKGVNKVNGSTYYRIPAITNVMKNGKPRLVTLTDDRLEHNTDLPSHCYLVAQYSDDLGKTWSEPKAVAGTAETGGDYGHGDASIVTNRDNGEITGIMVSSGTYGHGYFAGTNAQPARWRTITSTDGGETWSAPHDFTDDLYAAHSPNATTGNYWVSGFSGSGAALQKRDGTLVSSYVNRESPDASPTKESAVSQNFYFIMSKDGGKHWYVSGTSGTTAADEPKTLERNNGDLAISVRASGYNYHNVTSDNGKTWKKAPQTRFTSGINGNACDGEYMVWCSTLEGNEHDIAFQTLPASGNRENVSIALSTDEGETFGTAKTICPSGSAYSAATVLPDGTLGVYYEENGVFGGYTMRFVRFSLDWASNGLYKFTDEHPFYPIQSTRANADGSKDANGKATMNAADANKVATDVNNGVTIQHSYSADTRVSDINYDGKVTVTDVTKVVDSLKK